MRKRKTIEVEETKDEPVAKRKRPCCIEPGCKKQPTFGLDWGKATHCFKHALDGMEDVLHKRCQEPECKKIPSHGVQWRKPTHCSEHAPECMENVISKRCLEPGCKIIPTFGLTWKKPTHCSEHALDGMEDVKNKRCQEPGCKKKPTFGLDWGKATHCFKHALDGMEDVKHTRCLEPGCKKHQTFGLDWKTPTHCAEHALECMEDVISKRCEYPGCTTRPSYGNHMTGRAFCKKHMDRSEHWKLTTCKHTSCRRIATHSETGGVPFTFCESHSPDGFSSCKEQRCLGCNLPYLCDEEGYCLFSCTRLYKERTKVTENALNDFLEKKGLPFTRDTSPSYTCTAKRPDFEFRTAFGVVLVENDEDQHKGKVCECEQRRMMELHQSYGEAVHFIRFNPDRFVQSSTDKKGFVELPKRHGELYKLLQRLLKKPEMFFQEHVGLSVRYMYFDNCDTQEHFQIVHDIMY